MRDSTKMVAFGVRKIRKINRETLCHKSTLMLVPCLNTSDLEEHSAELFLTFLLTKNKNLILGHVMEWRHRMTWNCHSMIPNHGWQFLVMEWQKFGISSSNVDIDLIDNTLLTIIFLIIQGKCLCTQNKWTGRRTEGNHGVVVSWSDNTVSQSDTKSSFSWNTGFHSLNTYSFPCNTYPRATLSLYK